MTTARKILSVLLCLAIVFQGLPARAGGLNPPQGGGGGGGGGATYPVSPSSTSTGTVSGTNTFAAGPNATSTGNFSTAIGDGANNGTSTFATSVGRSASSGTQGTAVGSGATAGNTASTAVGQGSGATGSYGTSLGTNTTNVFNSSLALGYSATTTGNNQAVMGGDDGSGNGGINILFIGNGVSDAAPTSPTIRATGSTTNGTPGGTLNLVGGYHAQTPDAGGDVALQVVVPGSASYSTVLDVAGANGGVGIGTVTSNTVTFNAPELSVNQTWNNAGVSTFEAAVVRAKVTAGSGNLLDLYGGSLGQTSEFSVSNAGSVALAGGLVAGSPTGGNEGAGTINATAIYVNGSAVGGSQNLNQVLTTGAHASGVTALFDGSSSTLGGLVGIGPSSNLESGGTGLSTLTIQGRGTASGSGYANIEMSNGQSSFAADDPIGNIRFYTGSTQQGYISAMYDTSGNSDSCQIGIATSTHGVAGAALRWDFQPSGFLVGTNAMVIGFDNSSTDPRSAAPNVGLSSGGSAVMDLGNGSAGDASGTLNLTTLASLSNTTIAITPNGTGQVNFNGTNGIKTPVLIKSTTANTGAALGIGAAGALLSESSDQSTLTLQGQGAGTGQGTTNIEMSNNESSVANTDGIGLIRFLKGSTQCGYIAAYFDNSGNTDSCQIVFATEAHGGGGASARYCFQPGGTFTGVSGALIGWSSSSTDPRVGAGAADTVEGRYAAASVAFGGSSADGSGTVKLTNLTSPSSTTLAFQFGGTTTTSVTGAPTASAATSLFTIAGVNGAKVVYGVLHNNVTTSSGTSVNLATAVPAGSYVIAASFRITTAVTGASTSLNLEDSTGVVYATSSTFTLNTTSTPGLIFVSGNNYTASNTFKVVAGGGTFTAGVVECEIFYVTNTAPTS